MNWLVEMVRLSLASYSSFYWHLIDLVERVTVNIVHVVVVAVVIDGVVVAFEAVDLKSMDDDVVNLTEILACFAYYCC